MWVARGKNVDSLPPPCLLLRTFPSSSDSYRNTSVNSPSILILVSCYLVWSNRRIRVGNIAAFLYYSNVTEIMSIETVEIRSENRLQIRPEEPKMDRLMTQKMESELPMLLSNAFGSEVGATWVQACWSRKNFCSVFDCRGSLCHGLKNASILKRDPY